MTPWRAMIVAPLLAAAIIFAGVNAPTVINWVQSLPYIGPFFQRTISPNAASTLIFLGILCPAIPAIIGVALYRALVQMARDWKAQRIRERRKAGWLSRQRVVAPTVERLVQRKEGD
jgi:polyferredoxin